MPAPVDAVWAALNDPATLKSCVPGCESIEPTGENAYRMVIAQQVGPVSAKFTGTMQVSDVAAPRAYTLRFDGQSGAARCVNGVAHVSLVADSQSATTLSYDTRAQVSGKIAQVGSRLIDGVAARLTEEFFNRLAAAMTARVAAVPETVHETPRRLSARVVVLGMIVLAVAAVLVALLTR